MVNTYWKEWDLNLDSGIEARRVGSHPESGI
jgi:hypothetical protein